MYHARIFRASFDPVGISSLEEVCARERGGSVGGALRDNGIAITALHSHMLTDSPHLFFMHYWANDDALKLAHGLRAALDKMNVKKAG